MALITRSSSGLAFKVFLELLVHVVKFLLLTFASFAVLIQTHQAFLTELIPADSFPFEWHWYNKTQLPCIPVKLIQE